MFPVVPTTFPFKSYEGGAGAAAAAVTLLGGTTFFFLGVGARATTFGFGVGLGFGLALTFGGLMAAALRSSMVVNNLYFEPDRVTTIELGFGGSFCKGDVVISYPSGNSG